MLVLGIETSCDETGIALYHAERGLIAHALHSQVQNHLRFGGVVPELASRDHVLKALPLVDAVLKKADLHIEAIDGIAYTKGPGLMGALLSGAMLGAALAFALKVPLVGVHHLEGHLLAPCLEPHPPTFPFLALLVSGGHTELIRVNAMGSYELLGDTLDDAVGEAFDKTGRLLGLGYPAGAALAALAERGNPNRFHFPRPMIDRPGLEFSFSGLKTFAANTIEANTLDEQTKADIARAFQDAVVDTLTIKCRRAIRATGLQRLVVAGGVGANLALRASLEKMCVAHAVQLFFPRPEFCTDNGAMIAYVGCQRLLAGQRDTFNIEVNPRWQLQDLNQP